MKSKVEEKSSILFSAKLTVIREYLYCFLAEAGIIFFCAYYASGLVMALIFRGYERTAGK
jgi:hypothetical protein